MSAENDDLKSPDPSQSLTLALGDLHRAVGKPTSRQIADGVGSVSHTSIADTLAGRRIPSWRILEKIVVYLGGDVERFRALWADATAPPPTVTGESAVKRFVNQYRTQVAALNEGLHNPSDSRSLTSQFEDLYIQQRLRRINEADGDPPAFLSAADIADGPRRLLVLGPPGSGKSTLCQAIVRRAALDRNGPVPFFVQLRHFATGTMPTLSIIEYIEHQARVRYQVIPPPGAVENLLAGGRAIIVFDGLDEIADPAQVTDTAAILALFARGFPLSTMVITTRETVAHQNPLSAEAFKKYLLEELSDSDIAQYSRQWFGVDASVPAARRDELASNFLAQSSSLPDLRRNPLLLSLLCSLYDRAGYLPRNLVESCEMSADLLFRRWDSMRGIDPGPRPSTVLPALAFLANHILEHSDQGMTLPGRQIIQILAEYFESRFGDRDAAEGMARDFLDFCADHPWIFADIGMEGIDSVYAFTHLTFLEYFAALHLVRIYYSPERLAEHLVPRVSSGEWPMVGRFAVQLLDKNFEHGARGIALAMLKIGSSLSERQLRNIREFLKSCTELDDLPKDVTGTEPGEQASLVDSESSASRIEGRRGLGSTSATLLEPPVLRDRYRLKARLGVGGMGSVWCAEDLVLQRTVALKELRQLDRDDPDEWKARAVREARALARVRHPAIVSIHDIFFNGNDPWIVMEYIQGRSLADIIRDGPLNEREIAGIGLQVLGGLIATHQAGVVHRDVKPANILVTNDSQVFLVDFGISATARDMTLTGRSEVMGTPEFLAPEQILGQSAGGATDLWSLGVTLFCALEGYSPFQRRGDRPAEATMMAVINEDPPRLAHQGRLADIVAQLLRKHPSHRPAAQDLLPVFKSIINEANPPTPKLRQSMQPDGNALTATRMHEIREEIRSVDLAVGVGILQAVSETDAARIIADYPARTAGPLIEAIASARPQAAVSILQMLSSVAAGQAVDLISPRVAASVLIAMPASEAVRILDRTDVRTAVAVITDLPVRISAQLINSMRGKRAAAVLGYIRPATVAILLTVSNELNSALLDELDPPFRALVIRHLSGMRRAASHSH